MLGRFTVLGLHPRINRRVITLAQTGKIRMLVEHFTLDHADEAYQLLRDGKIRGRAVITPHS
jgi:propanol-preferring alcohol dehydrogenase